MRVESVRLHRVQIPFRGSFGHALSERSRSDAVFVELRDELGNVGWGEVLPRPYVTGETIEGVLADTGPALARRLLGQSMADRGAVQAWIHATLSHIGRDLAVFGGFELALLDLAGRRLGFSLAEVLGGEIGPSLPAGVVIGFEVATADLRSHCVKLRWSGKTHVKVKVGHAEDGQRLAAITRVFKDVPLRLDANAAWTASQAVACLQSWQPQVPIASIEQPVPADDIAGLREIRERTRIAVMADESVCTLADAKRLVAQQAADVFNVRPGKQGGMLASLALVNYAQTAGITLNLGTLVGESGVLSRAAEVFGRCVRGFACLDGKGQNHFLLEGDILRDNTADASDSTHTPGLDAPGLGVDVDPDAIASRTITEPVVLTADAR